MRRGTLRFRLAWSRVAPDGGELPHGGGGRHRAVGGGTRE